MFNRINSNPVLMCELLNWLHCCTKYQTLLLSIPCSFKITPNLKFLYVDPPIKFLPPCSYKSHKPLQSTLQHRMRYTNTSPDISSAPGILCGVYAPDISDSCVNGALLFFFFSVGLFSDYSVGLFLLLTRVALCSSQLSDVPSRTAVLSFDARREDVTISFYLLDFWGSWL